MSYLNSTDIRVFPATQRNEQSRLTTENAITTSIMATHPQEDGYVSRWDSNNNVIEFVLYGYYFKCKLPTKVFPEETPTAGDGIWASIQISNEHGSNDVSTANIYDYLVGSDGATTYSALNVWYSNLSPDEYVTNPYTFINNVYIRSNTTTKRESIILKILEYNGTTWEPTPQIIDCGYVE